MPSARAMVAILLLAVSTGGGCGPNRVNVQLRKDKQQLEERLAHLQTRADADRLRIQSLQDRVGTVPTLPQAKLDAMFTTHGIELNRFSGAVDLDPTKPGDEGIKVYVSPLDEEGDPIKATGHLTIEAFDLTGDPPRRLARKTIDPAELKQLRRDFGLLHAFVVTLPWQVQPRHQQVLIQASFVDVLTGRKYAAEHRVDVNLGDDSATTQPSPQP